MCPCTWSTRAAASPTPDTRAADRAALRATLELDIDPELLELALTHRSYAYEHGLADNERLEFLGDSVLGRAVTAMLYSRFPDENEGQLAKRRSALVSTVALAEVAGTIGLGAEVRLGRGEEQTDGRSKASILADTVEAVIGAAFLSVGSDAAEALVLRLIEPLAADPDRFGAAVDPKTSLQERAARRGAPAPTYSVTASGPDHARVFEATVQVGDLVSASATGTSKKQAETAAAFAAFNLLGA